MPLAEAIIDQNTAQLVQAQLLQSNNGHPGVHKFGGSSLASGEAIVRVANIIEQSCCSSDLIVLSAMGNTTDLLFELVQRCQRGNSEIDCNEVEQYQRGIIGDLFSQNVATTLYKELDADIQRIVFLLSRVRLGLPFNCDDVISYGEIWSTRIICAVLKLRLVECLRVDSRDLIYTLSSEQQIGELTGDQIDWPKSQQAFNDWSKEFSGTLAVVSGYIACDQKGNTVTLGRNGSDFSATIIAKLASAKMVYLWTDVNGVYSADPNQFDNTKVIPLLGINEANALANLGTPVFHEKTLKPLQDASIPIRIRNSQAKLDNNAGTLILPSPVKWQGAKTIALKSSVCLINIKWHNSLCDTAFFDVLPTLIAKHQISTYCWLSESSTTSFCVGERDHDMIAKLLEENSVAQNYQFSVRPSVSIVSLVGHELLQHAQHLSAYFSLIEAANQTTLMHHYDINGAISTVIDDSDPRQLVNDIHQAIFTQNSYVVDNKTQPQISLVICGFGNIGRKLIDILATELPVINQRLKNKLKVVAITNSRHYIFNEQGIALDGAKSALIESDLLAANIENDLSRINNQLAIVDVTASADVANKYNAHFSHGRHVISANKLGLTFPIGQYQQLHQTAITNNCQWLSNTTCGAGLPIQQSIDDLCISGDKITAIDGVFSGSLSWILNQYDAKVAFSTVVAQAKALGLTEPDPRDDLCGKDVQRKLLIIARTMGLPIDLEQIELSPLIPSEFFELSSDEYAKCDKKIDLFMQQKWQHANAQGLSLCYCGELSFKQVNGKTVLDAARVGLSFRESTDPLAGLGPADNIAVIRSGWHDANPLVIRGPGAGIEVTAAGIVSDLVKLAR